MPAADQNRRKPGSLRVQIRDARQQILSQQLKVDIHAARLARKIRGTMTAPTSLLLAIGTGFMAGELTKCQTPGFRGAAAKPRAAQLTALRFMTTAYAFYRALPLAWLMRHFREPNRPIPASERSVPSAKCSWTKRTA